MTLLSPISGEHGDVSMDAMDDAFRIADFADPGYGDDGRGRRGKIPVAELPRAVLTAAKARFPKSQIEEASKEVEDGVTIYEVTLKDGGQTVEVSLNGEGAILEIEKEVDADALPAAVKKAVAAKYPNEKIKKAEEITKGEAGSLLYELHVGSMEVVLDAHGKIIKTETDDDDDADDDDAKPKSAR